MNSGSETSGPARWSRCSTLTAGIVFPPLMLACRRIEKRVCPRDGAEVARQAGREEVRASIPGLREALREAEKTGIPSAVSTRGPP